MVIPLNLQTTNLQTTDLQTTLGRIPCNPPALNSPLACPPPALLAAACLGGMCRKRDSPCLQIPES